MEKQLEASLKRVELFRCKQKSWDQNIVEGVVTLELEFPKETLRLEPS